METFFVKLLKWGLILYALFLLTMMLWFIINPPVRKGRMTPSYVPEEIINPDW